MSDPQDFVVPTHLLRFDPTYDLLFKYLFEDEELLKGLLNRTLHLQEGELITKLMYLDRELSPEQLEHRGVIFDLLVTDQRGERYEVEVQRRDEGAQLSRALYYGARLLGAQLRSSALFHELLPVRVVMFTKFSLFPDPHPVRTFYPTPYLINKESSQRPLAQREPHLEPFDLSDVKRYAQRERFKKKERELNELRELLSVTIIELTKDFSSLTQPAQHSLNLLAHDLQEPSMNSVTQSKSIEESVKDLESSRDQLREQMLAELLKKDPWVQRFYQRLDQFAGDPKQLSAYEYTERALRDHISSLDYTLKDGIERGLKKGRKEGLEEGKRLALNTLKRSIDVLAQLGHDPAQVMALLSISQEAYEQALESSSESASEGTSEG